MMTEFFEEHTRNLQAMQRWMGRRGDARSRSRSRSPSRDADKYDIMKNAKWSKVAAIKPVHTLDARETRKHLQHSYVQNRG